MAATEEFVLDNETMRGFIEHVQQVVDLAHSPEDACDAIRPRFAAMLADRDWLPSGYRQPAPESGMGGGIGQWCLYRAENGSLTLFALVVPAGSQTPVHDHLAWGLVGLYEGEQEEEIFEQHDGAFERIATRHVKPGDFYSLIPPHEDIHRVRTISAGPSVSIHLLTNDTGCVWRHAYDEHSGEQHPFRSGYVNVPCDDDELTA
jgi:predicted metal-dependent enzyme (double-stranded beta helix superfamily)